MAFTYDPVGGAPAGAAGANTWEEVLSQEAASVSVLEFEDLLTDTYAVYKIFYESEEGMQIQVGNGSTYKTTAYRAEHNVDGGAKVDDAGAAALIPDLITHDDQRGEFLLFGTREADQVTSIVGSGSGNNGLFLTTCAGNTGDTTTYSSLRFRWNGLSTNYIKITLLGLKTTVA